MRSRSRRSHLWIKLLLFTFALVVFFFPVPASRISPVSAQSGAQMAMFTLPAATRAQAPRLKSPPVISAKEQARLQALQAQTHRRGPTTRVDPNPAMRAAPQSFPATTPRAAATRAQPRTGSSTNVPGTFTVFQNTDLHAIISNTVSVVAEPSAGNIGPAVLETSNWFAAVSTDGGSNFGYVDVYDPTFLPASYGGFCCDQSVLYDSTRNIMLWTLLYVPNSSSNIIRLAIANGEASFGPTSITVYYYDLSPQSIMQGGVPVFPIGQWYDYPQIALGSNYLYVTANVFAAPFPTGPFYKTVILRLPLSILASHGSLTGAAFISDDFNATPVRGATTTMFWATHRDTATMRIYNWPETGTVTSVDIPHVPYPNSANYTCPLTGGIQDWCGRLDDRVQAGWLSGGMLTFMWNAPQGAVGSLMFNYPYIQFLFVNSSTFARAGESTMNSTDRAYAYPSAGINAWGHVAGTLFYGGGAYPPTLAAFIWDDYSPTPYPEIPATWDVYDIAASTQGPEPSCVSGARNLCWGDYLSTTMDRTSPFSRFIWAATGFTLQGGGFQNNIHPYYLRFGREANDPAVVELNNKPLYFPIISTIQ